MRETEYNGGRFVVSRARRSRRAEGRAARGREGGAREGGKRTSGHFRQVFVDVAGMLALPIRLESDQ